MGITAKIMVHVIPRSKRTGIDGLMQNGVMKVRVSSPPIEGAANDELIAFISDVLGVRKGALRIISGHKGRDKVLVVDGMDQDMVMRKIVEWISREDHRKGG